METYISISFILIITILCAIGISEIIRMVENRIIKKENSHIISIIPLNGHVENVEYIIRSAIAEIDIKKSYNKSNIILINVNIDSETKKICELMCSKFPCITICKKDELTNIIRSILKNK